MVAVTHGFNHVGLFQSVLAHIKCKMNATSENATDVACQSTDFSPCVL